MVKRWLLAGLAILVAWTALDLLLHRWALAGVYASNARLWRSAGEMNVVLIYLATFALIAIFVGGYQGLVRPKSLGAGLRFGGLLGLALGIASGLGPYVHMPLTATLAWGWFLGGTLKGLAAGALLGWLIPDPPGVRS
ncbi:MAG TPA: hypothetical protein VF804_11995 [Holophagaceae bacterium]